MRIRRGLAVRQLTRSGSRVCTSIASSRHRGPLARGAAHCRLIDAMSHRCGSHRAAALHRTLSGDTPRRHDWSCSCTATCRHRRHRPTRDRHATPEARGRAATCVLTSHTTATASVASHRARAHARARAVANLRAAPTTADSAIDTAAAATTIRSPPPIRPAAAEHGLWEGGGGGSAPSESRRPGSRSRPPTARAEWVGGASTAPSEQPGTRAQPVKLAGDGKAPG